MAASLENRLRFTFEVLGDDPPRGSGPDFIVGLRYTGDEMQAGGFGAADGLEISRRLRDSGLVDFLNVVRGHIDTDAGLTDVIPIQGMANAPHLDFAGEIRAATGFPVFHAAKISDVATARHAIASGKLDMVGMTRAHMTDPHIVRKIIARPGGPHPALRRRELLPRPDLPGRRRLLHPQPRYRARADDAARHRQGRDEAEGGRSSARDRRGWRRRASPASAGTRSSSSRRRTTRAARSG